LLEVIVKQSISIDYFFNFNDAIHAQIVHALWGIIYYLLSNNFSASTFNFLNCLFCIR